MGYALRSLFYVINIEMWDAFTVIDDKNKYFGRHSIPSFKGNPIIKSG